VRPARRADLRRLLATLSSQPCWLLSAGLVAVLFAPVLHAQAVSVTDDRGVQLVLTAPALRVVTLAPHLTELVYAAGGGARLIAADSSSDYPQAASALPRVGDFAGVDVERILALQPDVVFGWLSGNKASDIDRLEHLGLKTFMSEPRRLDDIPRTLRALGAMLGSVPDGERAARGFEQNLERLRRAANAAPVAVFVEVWQQPLVAVGGSHIISDVLHRCGGDNVFGALRALAPPVSLESVLAADPEVIIGAGVPQEALADWRRHPHLRAVQRGQVHALDPALITRPTPRILQGAQQVCAWLDAARARR
jgi:iron complex transport system substrate-binding protein